MSIALKKTLSLAFNPNSFEAALYFKAILNALSAAELKLAFDFSYWSFTFPKLNKASFKFSLSHEAGSLASVLNTLKDFDLNLTKIQSLPIIEIPWKYSFFIDVTFKSIGDLYKSLHHIDKKVESIKVLGVYKNQMK